MIAIDGLTKRYGATIAVDDVSCAVLPGRVTGLLGPNGAGKSTLMKTLLGFNRAVRGSVSMFGMEMPRHALEVRQQLGYMPEREVVSPKVSAVSFLTYVGRLFGMNRVDAMERTHEVLNYVGLGESRYRKMDTYSTGMLQRVKLAQAIVHDPKLLLLDEPTNGLDPDGRIEMLDLIREIAKHRGVTVILSSHLLPDVQHVCDRVVMLHAGKVTREGNIAELTAPFARHFEVRVRDNETEFAEALQRAGLESRDQQNGNLLVSVPEEGDGHLIFQIAREQRTQVRHFQPARHSLAEIFVQAVGHSAIEN